MFKGKIPLILLCFIFITTTIILVYQQISLRQDPRVYSFSVETSDFKIKDIEFVVYPATNSVYVTDQYLEVIGENKKFSNIAYEISINNKMILSINQAEDPFALPDAYNGKITYFLRNLIQDAPVKSTDEININLIYVVNGVTYNKVGAAKLENLIKPTSTTGDNNLNTIHL